MQRPNRREYEFRSWRQERVVPVRLCQGLKRQRNPAEFGADLRLPNMR